MTMGNRCANSAVAIGSNREIGRVRLAEMYRYPGSDPTKDCSVEGC